MTEADLQTAFSCKHFLHTPASSSLRLLHSLCWIRLEENRSPTITSAADGKHIETQLAWALVAMAICSCTSAWMRNATFHRPRDTHGSVEPLHRSCACFGTTPTEPMPQRHTLAQPCYSQTTKAFFSPITCSRSSGVIWTRGQSGLKLKRQTNIRCGCLYATCSLYPKIINVPVYRCAMFGL